MYGDGTDRDPEDKNNSGADRLLEAVTLLLVERGAALAAASLKPDDVAARAGKSRASYYRTDGFPGTDLATGEESRMAVLEAALRRGLQRSARQVEQVTDAIDEFVEIGWRHMPPAEFLRSVSIENFDATADPDLITQLFAAALSVSSDIIADDLGNYYAEVTSTFSEQYRRLLDVLGYRMRPPYTIEHLAVGLMALAEGLAIRSLVDETITRDLYGNLVSHLAGCMMLAPGEAVDPFDPRHRAPAEPTTPLRRSEIIACLVRLLDGHRESMPSLDELAHRVGCSTEAITASFGSVTGVARAAWDEWAPEFVESIERDRRSTGDADPITLLYRCCLLIATRAAEQPGVARAVLIAEAGEGHVDGTRPDAVAEPLGSLLEEAAVAGIFTAPTPPGGHGGHGGSRFFAMSLRTTILTLVVTSPRREGVPADEHGRACVDYAWAVMMPPRHLPPGPSGM